MPSFLRAHLSAVPIAITLGACPLVVGAQELQLQERWSTSGPRGAELGYIAGMAEASDGSIWIADNLGQGVIVAVDSDGTSFRTVARHGDGPGEVRAPTLIARHPSGTLAVLDMARFSIDFFSGRGRFDRRVQLPLQIVNPKGFAILASGELLLSGGATQNREQLHLIDAEGELLHSWLPVPETEDIWAGRMVAGGPLTALSDGSALFSRAAPHEISRLEPGGRSMNPIASDPAVLDAIGDDFIETTGSGETLQRRMRWFFPQSRGVFQLANGRILNVVWNREDRSSIWEVYSPGGERLIRQLVARDYQPWAMTANGDILASYLDPDTDEEVATRIAIRFAHER